MGSVLVGLPDKGRWLHIGDVETGNTSSEMCSALFHLAIIAIPSFSVYFFTMFILSKEVITDGRLSRAACSIFTRV